MIPSKEPQPVIEESPGGDDVELTMRALNERVRQQEILSELGVIALQGADFETLLSEAAKLTAAGLRCEFCKVLQFRPGSSDLIVRAGVGWDEDVVGRATIGADLASPAGFALRTGQPVISNHLENEDRFRTPELLARHGIRRAMNVILQGDGSPFGVLEVDSSSEDEFVEHDLAFLQGAANLLGMAIERERYDRKLNAALERHKVLLAEVNHRVKNSLQLVLSMFRLQANSLNNPEFTRQIDEASSRVSAIAVAHERLYRDSDIEMLDLGQYLTDMWRDGVTSACKVEVEAPVAIRIKTDRAIPLVLVVNELVTNAAKYAYGENCDGTIWIAVALADERSVRVTVRDEGAGLPQGFDPAASKGLGMRIVRGLSAQLDATVAFEPGANGRGATAVLLVPLDAQS